MLIRERIITLSENSKKVDEISIEIEKAPPKAVLIDALIWYYLRCELVCYLLVCTSEENPLLILGVFSILYTFPTTAISACQLYSWVAAWGISSFTNKDRCMKCTLEGIEWKVESFSDTNFGKRITVLRLNSESFALIV